MLMQEERELVVEDGKKMSAARLSTGTSGNISIYNAEKGLVALSPSGMDYFSTTPEDDVILDLDGKVVDGKRKPSSEWALHTTFYKHKPHARAVVHTHSMFCTTMAVLGGLTLSGRKLVISLVLAFVILHEQIDLKTVLGALLITAGTFVMIL